MDIVRDPVCGELIAWDKAAGVLSYRGKFYYFCCKRCFSRFLHSPGQFVKQMP